jgi:hypothetical protein
MGFEARFIEMQFRSEWMFRKSGCGPFLEFGCQCPISQLLEAAAEGGFDGSKWGIKLAADFSEGKSL